MKFRIAKVTLGLFFIAGQSAFSLGAKPPKIEHSTCMLLLDVAELKDGSSDRFYPLKDLAKGAAASALRTEKRGWKGVVFKDEIGDSLAREIAQAEHVKISLRGYVRTGKSNLVDGGIEGFIRVDFKKNGQTFVLANEFGQRLTGRNYISPDQITKYFNTMFAKVPSCKLKDTQ